MTGIVRTRSCSRVFPVAIDYSMGLKQLLLAGKFRPHNPDPDDCFPNDDFPSGFRNCSGFNFPHRGKALVKFRVLRFTTYPDPGQVTDALKAIGCRPANLHELISFGVKYHGSLNPRIVATGSCSRYTPRTAASFHVPSREIFGYPYISNYYGRCFDETTALYGYYQPSRFLAVVKRP